jgi:hypothetical protein
MQCSVYSTKIVTNLDWFFRSSLYLKPVGHVCKPIQEDLWANSSPGPIEEKKLHKKGLVEWLKV